MPDAAAPAPPPPEAVLPEAAPQTRREESRGIFWLLVVSGVVLVVPGWLLPWFDAPTANGIGFSPQDALTQLLEGSPTGIGSFLVLVMGISMLAILAGVVSDVLALFAGIGRPFRFLRWRGHLALAGVAATFAIWVLIGIYQEEPLFGPLDGLQTDNAVWMALTGFGVCAIAFLQGERIVPFLGSAAGAGLAVTGVAVPWFRTDAEVISQASRHSLLDALATAGPGYLVLLLVVLAGVAIAVASFVVDGIALVTGRARALLAMPRTLALVAAAGAAVAVTSIVTATRHPVFGSGYTTLDNRGGFIVAGLLVAALVALLGERMVVNRTVALAVVAFCVGGLFPLIFNQSVGFISWGASAAAIYILLSLGLNVVVGFAGLLDLGYAAFFAIGAYTCASLNSPRHGLFLPFWVILFIGAAVAALFGAILGAPTLRLRGDYLAIVTLGFGEIVPDMANNDLFHQTGGPEGITGIRSPSIGGYTFGLDAKPYYWTLLIIIALVIIALRNLERSRLGRAWVAIREDEVAAAATGINTVTTKLLAFAIGASVSGLAGAFYGAFLGIVSPDDFEFAVSVTALSTVVLGGIGNNYGAAVGALLISFIIFWILPHMQEWMGTFGHTTGITSLSTVDFSQYKFMIYGVILIVVMLLRPGGLLPSRARRVELQQGGESESLAAVQGTA